MDSTKQPNAIQIEASERKTCSCAITPDMIRAITPVFLGTIGLVIGVAALVAPSNGNDAKWSSAFGLAGTAIAGAAGLAQSRSEASNGNRDNGNSRS
jgi:hypothetical protein